ncbi:hypothetical protein BRC83_05500 [Halobacteriales archaeon QS_1_68_17]|nr:MAG: hypothetical protein BRC83_05500 [Halobacteriales archaeon QS_1_68_17]
MSGNRRERASEARIGRDQREILRFLDRSGGRVEGTHLVSVALCVARRERQDDAGTTFPFDEVHDRVTTQYLPELERGGLVDFCREDDAVTLLVSGDDLGALLADDDSA